jgi:hypothetical protein
VYTILGNIKDALDGIASVSTCKIGIEADISPADYPIIRIVPQSASHASVLSRKKIVVYVYFGTTTAEADGGLEAVYEDLCDMEADIVEAMEKDSKFIGEWVETVTDEDAIEGYKVMYSKFNVTA